MLHTGLWKNLRTDDGHMAHHQFFHNLTRNWRKEGLMNFLVRLFDERTARQTIFRLILLHFDFLHSQTLSCIMLRRSILTIWNTRIWRCWPLPDFEGRMTFHIFPDSSSILFQQPLPITSFILLCRSIQTLTCTCAWPYRAPHEFEGGMACHIFSKLPLGVVSEAFTSLYEATAAQSDEILVLQRSCKHKPQHWLFQCGSRSDLLRTMLYCICDLWISSGVICSRRC